MSKGPGGWAEGGGVGGGEVAEECDGEGGEGGVEGFADGVVVFGEGG